jgi:Protein of unknown function (DUF4238)
VPRCALAPFGLNGEGLAINLFNIARAMPIQNAPAKGQCSRGYFYGKNLGLEKELIDLEGQYARIVSALSTGKFLSDRDKEWLYIFFIVQMHRTERAVERLRDFIDKMADAAFVSHPDQRPEPLSHVQLVLMSMDAGLKQLKHIIDLKLIVLRNKTNINFVISDNPATMTKKFHFEQLNKADFGIASAGALISLPLTPRLTALLYDSAVYSIPNATGTPFVDIRQDQGVVCLNGIQYLSADNNIYFKDWSEQDHIAAEVNKVRECRRGIERMVRTFVPDGDLPEGTRWRRGSLEEELTTKRALILSSAHYPRPIEFPLFIKYRQKPKAFSNGSAIGFVRKAEWMRRTSW